MIDNCLNTTRVALAVPALLCASFLLAATPLVAQDAAAAKRYFLNACGVCHSSEPGAPHRQGPNLFGVFGKPAGGVGGFKYSDALKASGLTWDEATLDHWLTDSQAARAGTVMLYKQANPERRQLAIDYLKTLK